ncbi:hypothetical protein [Caulobacter endophyticus]|uniref:hypothetical protein n=1 Tax=Caulobacter endophyticus TaxID=2172652 RepID=UPI00240F5330|nr:hypothetical protein [Caulobacter endophyticus]MDG2527342.1 hypothetical protein [Caulobacter endophyticus]
MVVRLLALSALVVVLAACTPGPAGDLSPQVAEVIARADANRSTYAAYGWNERLFNKLDVSRWNARFSHGALRRDETASSVLIADCDAGMGFGLFEGDEQIIKGKGIARALCGVDAPNVTLASIHAGQVPSPQGHADKIRLRSRYYGDLAESTYTVGADGVVLSRSLTIATRKLRMETRAVVMTPNLPPGDLFDTSTLNRRFTPERYRYASAPKT